MQKTRALMEKPVRNESDLTGGLVCVRMCMHVTYVHRGSILMVMDMKPFTPNIFPSMKYSGYFEPNSA